jgi:hypothetical protein
MGKGVRLKAALCLLALLGAACSHAAAPPPRQAPAIQEAPASAPAPATADSPSTEVPVKLTAEHISPVIAAAAPRIKDLCWQPALDSRAADVPPMARVMVTADIDRSGKVTAVHADGGTSAYPQLAECIATVVRSLTFREAATVTTVNIPFVFDARDSAPHD